MKKTKKGWFIGLWAVMIIGYLGPTLVLAQDMGIWEGKWFKITQNKGKYLVAGDKFQKGSESTVFYLKVDSWDPVYKALNCVSLYGEGLSNVMDITLYYIGGSNLDFLCWFQYSATWNDLVIGPYAALVVQIKGTLSGMELKGAKFKTLGGCVTDDGFVGSLKWTGSLVPEEDVPSASR